MVVAPFLVGVAAAVAMETSATLLLYMGRGLLPAVSLVVAVGLAALAVGLWAGSRPGSERLEVLRRRWLGTLLAFAAAAALSAGWMMLREIGTTMPGRALGLGLLVAWPLYAVGVLLAGLGARGGEGPVAASSPTGVVVAAGAGGAAGFLLTGTFLIPNLAPPSVFLGCVVLLSGGALLYGSTLRDAAAEARAREGNSPSGRARAWTEMDGRSRMRDKVVLVTGVGGRGQVGYAVAEALLRAGAHLIITARDEARVREHAKALAVDGSVLAVGADLAREEGARRVIDAAAAAHGRLDGVVNAVGGLHVIAPVAETDPAAWEREVQSNVWTVYQVCRAALPLLRESRGAVVNFASRTPLSPAKNLGAYTVGKAGVIALTRTVALEELEHGVRVNALAPGMMETEQNRRDVEDPQSVAWVGLDEVAAAVLFLLSDAASAITGQVIELTPRPRSSAAR